MQVLSTILYIVLFLVFLSILIMIHELGHLAAAKAFRVYCLEYSIGMGPALFKFKRKKGETQISLRAIPFGGYVSMYGEGVPLPDGVTVDESRSLNNIKAWKRAIVLLAGVTMNAVLALIFFFISNCFPQESIDYINHLNVKESVVGLSDGDFIRFDGFQYYDEVAKTSRIAYLADNQTIIDDDTTKQYATCFNFEKLNSFKHLDLAEYIYFYQLKNDPINLYSKTPLSSFDEKLTIYIADDAYYAENAFKILEENGIIADYSMEKYDATKLDYELYESYKDITIKAESLDKIVKLVEEGEADIKANKNFAALIPSSIVPGSWNDRILFGKDNNVPDFTKYVDPASFDKATVHFTKRVEGTKGGNVDGEAIPFTLETKDGAINSFGLSIYYTRIQYNFGEAVGHTFSDFGNNSILLFKTIGSLFTDASTWKNVGGIVAVGFETTSVLQNLGFGKFLYYWGFISVNLAIFNLLPFPGLDGWQLLVLGVESTTRKKIPEKVKNIVSLIGIGLLLALMVVVVFKDLFKYVFVGLSLL